ncbi:MAG: hypothetical protein ACRDD7_12460, partial [Peptostreptococcaceae bacterium]
TAIEIFSNDKEVVEIGAKTLRTMMLMYPLLGFTQLYAVLYQSLGMAKEALIVGTSRQGLFFVPLVFVLPRLLGMNGVLLVQPIADLCTVFVTAFYAHKTNKLLKEKENTKVYEEKDLISIP